MKSNFLRSVWVYAFEKQLFHKLPCINVFLRFTLKYQIFTLHTLVDTHERVATKPTEAQDKVVFAATCTTART